MSYHNTTGLVGGELRQAEAGATKQERIILRLFSGLHDGHGLTPSQVHRKAFQSTVPITSVRRAITNLTDRGELVKTDDTAPGPYGRPEHLWIKAPATGQVGLFTHKAA